MKPKIIVVSGSEDDTFKWLSDGWNSITEGTARRLMRKACDAIKTADDYADAIRRLENAGFEVEENND